MSIIIFQHSDLAGPGRLGATLRDNGFKLDIRRLDLASEGGGDGGGVPGDLDGVQGVVVLGGPQNVGDSVAWFGTEMAFIKSAHEAQLPVIGICLGAQLVAAALGGQVGPMDTPEWGMLDVSINTGGQIEPMLAGIAWTHKQFQCHGQEIKELSAGATLLASSEACKVQAFKAGIRTYGFQFHFECDRLMAEQIAEADREQMSKAGLSMADLGKQFDESYGSFARLSDRLCVNLTTYLFPMSKKLVG